MGSIYNRDHGDKFQFDLLRDLAALTHPLTQDERSSFIHELIPELTSPTPDHLVFDSFDSLKVFLTQAAQVDGRFFGSAWPSQHAALESVLEQAEFMSKNVREIIFTGDALLYDFSDPSTPVTIGGYTLWGNPEPSTDLYVEATFQSAQTDVHGLKIALQDYLRSATNTDDVRVFLSKGAMEEDVGDHFYPDTAAEEATDTQGMASARSGIDVNGLSMAFDEVSQFDFKDIPFEIFSAFESGPSKITFSTDEKLFMMSCLKDFTASQRRILLNETFDLYTRSPQMRSDNHNDPLTSDREGAILAALDRLRVIAAISEIDFAQAKATLSRTHQIYTGLYRDFRSSAVINRLPGQSDVSVSKLYPDERHKISKKYFSSEKFGWASFIDRGTSLIEDLNSKFPECLERLDAIEINQIATQLFYLSSEEVASLIDQICSLPQNQNLVGNKSFGLNYQHILSALAGLSYADMQSVLRNASSKKYLEQSNFISDYQSYRHSPKYQTHEQAARRLAPKLSSHLLKPELIMDIAMIESRGDENAFNGTYCGLLQIGPDGYRALTDKSISIEDLRRGTTGDRWENGMRRGAELLNHYATQNNPLGSIGIMIGSYNWGDKGMVEYRLHAIYGIGQKKNLHEQTLDYITKYVALQILRQG